KRWIILGLNKI
nr:Chain C, 11-mer peptide [Human immunodeficiency virus 1]